jgi:hypothetical protein
VSSNLAKSDKLITLYVYDPAEGVVIDNMGGGVWFRDVDGK